MLDGGLFSGPLLASLMSSIGSAAAPTAAGMTAGALGSGISGGTLAGLSTLGTGIGAGTTAAAVPTALSATAPVAGSWGSLITPAMEQAGTTMASQAATGPMTESALLASQPANASLGTGLQLPQGGGLGAVDAPISTAPGFPTGTEGTGVQGGLSQPGLERTANGTVREVANAGKKDFSKELQGIKAGMDLMNQQQGEAPSQSAPSAPARQQGYSGQMKFLNSAPLGARTSLGQILYGGR